MRILFAVDRTKIEAPHKRIHALYDQEQLDECSFESEEKNTKWESKKGASYRGLADEPFM